MADYIRRDIVLKIINTVNDTGGFAGYADYCVLFDEIDTMPASDVQPVNQWISVDDKLPATRKTVLIYDEYEGVSAGYYDSDYAKFRSIDDVYRSCNVTHWQPLPEPPKDGDPE